MLDVQKTAKKRIGELLIENGLITSEQLEEALQYIKVKGGKTAESLIALGHLDSSAYIRYLSHLPGVASVELQHYFIPEETLKMVPADFAKQHEIIPLDKMGKYLTVAMVCPLDSASIQKLEEKVGLTVRSLLVSKEDIQISLRKYYGDSESEESRWALKQNLSGSQTPRQHELETDSRLARIITLVRQVEQLPALSETVQELQRVIESQEATTDMITAILQRDPALSAKVLSLANSIAYSFIHRVNRIDLAVSLLGLREIYKLALSAAVTERFEKSSSFDYDAFWQRSLRCAMVARLLVPPSKKAMCNTVATAGLLHDLGRLVLAEVIPDAYAEIDQSLPDDLLAAEEIKHFGIEHAEIGYVLADTWNLPSEITAPMRFHQKYEMAKDLKMPVAAVALASILLDEKDHLLNGEVDHLPEKCAALLEMMELPAEAFIVILDDVVAAILSEL